MDKFANVLQGLMWFVAVLAVVIFVVTIIVGHATSYDFLYSFGETNSTLVASAVSKVSNLL